MKYLHSRQKQLLETLEKEEDRLAAEDPDQLQRIYLELGRRRTDPLPPYSPLCYHPDLIEVSLPHAHVRSFVQDQMALKNYHFRSSAIT